MTTSTPSLRVRLGAALAALLVASLLAPATPAAAASPKWAGYRIAGGGSAASGWMGAHRVGGRPAYRIDPTKRSAPTRYKRARRVANLGGRAGASARDTARAAYVVSNFGGRRDNIQAAAVDAVTYHLLKGGRWKLNGSRGAARIRQTGGNRRYVRSYAVAILKDANKFAGPYRRKLTTTAAAVGAATRAELRITSAKGAGIKGRRVTFTYPGATPVTAYTDGSGRAVAYFTVTSPTPEKVTATVSGLPEWRLLVRKPKKRKASRVIVANRVTKVSNSAVVSAISTQTVTVANSQARVLVGASVGGTYTLTGGSGTREVTRSLHGPFASPDSNCATSVVTTSTVSETEAGTRPLPGHKTTQSGYYRWGVNVAANPTSTRAFACGAAVRVRAVAALAQARPEGRPVRVRRGAPLGLEVKVTGFDRIETHLLTSRLYGPFETRDAARCVDRKRVGGMNQTRNVRTNGTYSVPNAGVRATGWYVWQTSLSNGALIRGAISGCSVAYQVVN